jgi:uncharacterized membrane protein
MVLVFEIVAGIVAVLLAAFIVIVLMRRRRPGAAPHSEPSGAVEAPAPKKRKVSDTKAFRQYAHGDIDHDEYREILEKNQKESG